MNSPPGLLIRYGSWAYLFLAVAAFTWAAIALAQSAEASALAALPMQVPLVGSLTVVNKPIFAPPRAGEILLSADPHPAGRSVMVSAVTRFRVVFPPASPAGKLTLSGTGAVLQRGWKPQRWYQASALGIRIVKLAVQWRQSIQGIGAASAPTSARAAVIRVDGVSGTLKISAGSALAAGGEGIGRGRDRLEQIVVEVRVKNGNTEKIQFLPLTPRHRKVLLGPSTPSAIRIHVPAAIVAAGTPPQLSLAVAAVSIPSGEKLHPAQRSISANSRSRVVWVNLVSGAAAPSGKPVAGRMLQLRFRLAGGSIRTNYAREMLLAGVSIARLKSVLRLITLQQKNGIDVEGLGNKYRTVKRLLAEVVARYRRLRALGKLTLCVELYPGGPVLETITFKKPTAATRPVVPKPIGAAP